MQLVHGGDIYSYAAAHHGAIPLDLSANINPFGIPPRVRQAMKEAVDECDRYPDPLCRALRDAIAESEGVPAEFLFCGNGAAEVLFRLSASIHPRCALLTAPTFAEYEQSLGGCELRFHTLCADEDFAVTEAILAQITPDLDAVYLCNPNNPTGRTIAPALLRAIAEKCASLACWLIVDECFHDFLLDAARHTLKDLLGIYPRLVLLRAFTKMYAVPGVRLGYCMTANAALVERLYRAGQPWNVSVIAQACGAAAAREGSFARETARRVAEERDLLRDALHAQGLTVFPSEVNFLLLHAQDKRLHNALAEHGVLVRDCANYRGLSAGYYRVAVRCREEQQRFLIALTQSMEDVK